MLQTIMAITMRKYKMSMNISKSSRFIKKMSRQSIMGTKRESSKIMVSIMGRNSSTMIIMKVSNLRGNKK